MGITVRNNNNMLSSALLSGLLMISGQNIDFPEVWKKIEGKWSYVGEVKEKPQILFWIEKKTKSKSKKPALLTAKANKELQKILKSKKLSENPNTIALYSGHCKRFFLYLKKKLHK